MNVLFAASEVYSLVKTGGLGDVIYALPQVLKRQGSDARIVIPAYRAALERCNNMEVVVWLSIQGAGRHHDVRIVRATAPELDCPLYLVDCQALYDRPGNPYLAPNGGEWEDNAERFTVFCNAVAEFALGGDKGWRPDVVHANDWQTGFIPAFLREHRMRPQTVFTIHNLAYGGNFSRFEYDRLMLPWHWWGINGVEFHNGFSMLKAGIVYSDKVNTVSPTYAKEVLTPAFGYGLDGLLHDIGDKFSGILNGIDEKIWNPELDTYLPRQYTPDTVVSGKKANKKALLESFNLNTDKTMLARPLAGFVGRMVEQKGIGLMLAVLPELFEQTDLSMIFIGSGDARFEHAVQSLSEAFPERCGALIGYSEERAHLLEAGVDFFLMPSAFEPCGLNQLYSLKYGTPPVVHKTGGLADSVVHADKKSLQSGTATGFVFDEFTPYALNRAIRQALVLYKKKTAWKNLVLQAMEQDFSWDRSAVNYQTLYQELVSSV
jgi:starch synthase